MKLSGAHSVSVALSTPQALHSVNDPADVRSMSGVLATYTLHMGPLCERFLSLPQPYSLSGLNLYPLTLTECYHHTQHTTPLSERPSFF
jgi:hypothetical protein